MSGYKITAATQTAAKRVSEIRASRKLSQEGLAAKCGIHRVTIARLERGKFPPNVETLACIARALRVKVSTLVTP